MATYDKLYNRLDEQYNRKQTYQKTGETAEVRLTVKRIRDYGITIGELPAGKRNAITDVEGVEVGHLTLNGGPVQTGVTAILPHGADLFRQKLQAAVHVINGFGKSTGIVQIDELDTLETPIVMTNTLSVGTAYDALIDYMLERNPEIGDTTGTVNPVVCECNDGFLNDIRGKHVKKEHVMQALNHTSAEVLEGAVGAGTGMSCFGFKGGIGTASRKIPINNNEYVVGVLVLSNFGRMKDFIMDGKKVGRRITDASRDTEKGSIIVIMATDIPLSEHQLKRVIKRSAIGIERTGSFSANGSGEIAIGFSTAFRIPHKDTDAFVDMKRIHENKLDLLFRAVAEAAEEAVLNSLVCADTTVGRNGHRSVSLREYAHLFA
ncbi:MAG TPA: P1 family peptidase [Bacillales bacterium]|nr:P1 family peptidase [Bacillales bacterium]